MHWQKIMADVISIAQKRKAVQDQDAMRLRRRKIYAVRQAMQCRQCHLKCEKCGTQLEGDAGAVPQKHTSLRVPYRFCLFCAQDYVDYIERLQGRGDAQCYWQNDAWRDAWARWISYQGALDSFVKSAEFARLITEVRGAPDEE